MSQRAPYSIACPRCREPIAAQLYESVNVAEDPGLRMDLIEDRLNRVACPACAFEYRVDKPLLYHDPAHALLVWWRPEGRTAPEETAAAVADLRERLREALPEDTAPPELQLVFDRVELIERIFVVESGLNPRLIEYVKYLMFSRNTDRLDPAKTRLLYNAQDSTAEVMCFVVQDIETLKLRSLLHYRRDAFDSVRDMFDGARAEGLRELFPGPYISARALALE
jgi:hypothetical protein